MGTAWPSSARAPGRGQAKGPGTTASRSLFKGSELLGGASFSRLQCLLLKVRQEMSSLGGNRNQKLGTLSHWVAPGGRAAEWGYRTRRTEAGGSRLRGGWVRDTGLEDSWAPATEVRGSGEALCESHPVNSHSHVALQLKAPLTSRTASLSQNAAVWGSRDTSVPWQNLPEPFDLLRRGMGCL